MQRRNLNISAQCPQAFCERHNGNSSGMASCCAHEQATTASFQASDANLLIDPVGVSIESTSERHCATFFTRGPDLIIG